MKGIKVIIFDVDGTIFNTDELYFDVLRYELKKFNVTLTAKQYGEHGLDDVINTLALENSIVEKVQANVLRRYYNPNILLQLAFKKGILSTIHSLSQSYKLAIGSGENVEQIQMYLEHKNMGKYFDFVGHGALVPNRKSNPEYFYKIARFFGVEPSECLMVGDSVLDSHALRAGCKVAIIPSKFTQYCVFDEQCIVLRKIEDLTSILESENLINT